MLGCTPTVRKFKLFVKETNGNDPVGTSVASGNYLPVRPLTGEKAKQFYEEVLNEPSSVPEIPKVKAKTQPRCKPPRLKKFKNTDLLWMAQNNDVRALESFFSEEPDCDVNIMDEFGWTPLMCAACSGAEKAVEILLQKGADPNRRDKMGNTAHKFAQQRNYKRISEMLKNYWKECEKAKRRVKDLPEPFDCGACNGRFRNKRRHESSTLHLFNCPIKTSTFYGIPETNKGFQLLLKEGWEREKGLGRDGRGRKFPVRAVMKKDRTGIGAPPLPERIQNESNTIGKYNSMKDRLNKYMRDKHFEKSFRLEFS